MLNVTLTGRDNDDRPTFKANIKETPGDWVVFTFSSKQPLTDTGREALGATYGSLLKLATEGLSGASEDEWDLAPIEGPGKARGISVLEDLHNDGKGNSDVGRKVRYISKGGDKVEYGRIKSWNNPDGPIFVVYGDQSNYDDWQNYTAAATDPADLEFV